MGQRGTKAADAGPFLDCFVVKESASFETPISMADLANSMKTGDDGSITFDFSNIPGVKVTHGDQK